MAIDKEECALLGNEDGFTVFSYGGTRIRFRAPFSLVRYTDVKEWDNGYLVVDALYEHQQSPEEEYIDLVPILKNLYLDPKAVFSANSGSKDKPYVI